jgi:MFS family permease
MALGQKERAFAAVFAGIIVGFIVIMAVEMLTPYHPPADISVEDKAKLGEWIAGLPFAAFAILLMAYFLGAATGGFVTNKIASPTRYRPALITGFGLFAAGIANVLSFPHPLWFVIASSLIYFIGAWIGGRAATR